MAVSVCANNGVIVSQLVSALQKIMPPSSSRHNAQSIMDTPVYGAPADMVRPADR